MHRRLRIHTRPHLPTYLYTSSNTVTVLHMEMNVHAHTLYCNLSHWTNVLDGSVARTGLCGESGDVDCGREHDKWE